MVKLINASIRTSKFSLCLLTAIALLVCVSSVGYSEEFGGCITSEEEPILPSDFENMMVLGNAEEIPEALDVMALAWNNVRSTLPDPEAINVRTTHYYIKCAPRNEDELDRLENMSEVGVYFYDHPFYHKIIDMRGGFYHDSRLPLDQPTYQYAAIPADYAFPERIDCNILEALYLPEQDSLATDEVAVNALIQEAMSITGHAPEAISSWVPSGSIKFEEFETKQMVGVRGVEVRTKRGFNTLVTTTDAQGHFQMNGTHKYSADHFIYWRTNKLKIRNNSIGQATYDGPRIKSPWNVSITHGIQRFYGGIYLPAYHYYHQDIQTLRRPQPNLKIRAYNRHKNNVPGFAAGFYQNSNKQYIAIYNHLDDGSPYYGADYTKNMGEWLYAAITHELAHASHYYMVKDNNSVKYNDIENRIYESWAMGVGWVLTRMRYPNYELPFVDKDYTWLVQDMVDPANQGGYINIDNLEPYDKVGGYHITQIEDALYYIEDWYEWRDYIKELFNHPDENQLDTLFHYWGNY